MNMLLQHVHNILAIDRPTLIVICVLCGMASLFLKEYLAIPLMIIFVYPVLVLFSVLAQYAFILLELFSANRLDQWLMWTILASIIGAISGTLLVAAMSALRDRQGKARAGT